MTQNWQHLSEVPGSFLPPAPGFMIVRGEIFEAMDYGKIVERVSRISGNYVRITRCERCHIMPHLQSTAVHLTPDGSEPRYSGSSVRLSVFGKMTMKGTTKLVLLPRRRSVFPSWRREPLYRQ